MKLHVLPPQRLLSTDQPRVALLSSESEPEHSTVAHESLDEALLWLLPLLLLRLQLRLRLRLRCWLRPRFRTWPNVVSVRSRPG